MPAEPALLKISKPCRSHHAAGEDRSTSPETPVFSPLMPSVRAEFVEEISADEIVRLWREKIGIDVAAELDGIQSIRKFRCPVSALEFFDPPESAGGASFYESLQAFPFYYMEDKWEHQETLQHLPESGRFLEIGCGEGAFVNRAAAHGLDAMGVELNAAAVAEGQAAGLKVECRDVLPFSHKQAGSFDCVAAFQVLEHIADPVPFLEAAVRLLKPGGRLVIGVPNGFGWYGRLPWRDSLLDGPPHHMGKWNAAALQFLTRILPIDLRHFDHESLQDYHVDLYIASLLGRLSESPQSWWRHKAGGLLHRGIRAWIRATGAQTKLAGHTLLAQFVRRPSAD